MMTVIGFITALVGMYPFTLEQTFIIIGVLKAAFDALINRKWKDLEKVVMEQALPLVTEMLSNEEKRDAVVLAVYKKMPAWFRMFAKAEDVDKFVDLIYNTQVKPKAKRMNLESTNKDKNGNIILPVEDSIFAPKEE